MPLAQKGQFKINKHKTRGKAFSECMTTKLSFETGKKIIRENGIRVGKRVLSQSQIIRGTVLSIPYKRW